MELRNLKQNHVGGIDLEFNHPKRGWLPCSTHPDDAPTAEMYAAALSGEFGAVTPYVKPLATAQAEKFAELQAAYDATIYANIEYLDAMFQADEYSQQVLVKSLSGGALYAPDFWQDAANVIHAVTFAELQGLSGAMLARGKAAFIQLQTRKQQVRSAITTAEVEAVTWN